MKLLEKVRQYLLPMLLVFALAVPVRASCNHDFVEMRQDPTCENSGFVWLQCQLCSFALDVDPLPPLGHTFDEWYVLTEPTCSKDGVQARDCVVCGHRETAPLPHTGHMYEPKVKHPTCTAGGYTRYNCRACTSYYIAEYMDPLGHRYDDGIVLKEPTETDQGRVRFTCTRCTDPHLVYYSFQDIATDSYYFTPVIWSVDNSITSGLDETHFGPDVLCNRAQAVTFLWRAAGKPEPMSADNPFADVPDGCFYQKAVLWAFETGITTGTDECHFSPELHCSRAQVVTFLWRAADRPEPESAANPFPDVSAGCFYEKAVLWAFETGITAGTDECHFSPNLSCNRAQIVTFLYRDANP